MRPGKIGFLLIATLGIAFAGGASSATESHDRTTPSQLHRIENGFVIPLGEGHRPLRLNLQQLMSVLNVPGLSVAVIDNFKVAWAKGYGVTDAGSTTPVTPYTLFQAGSVSKPVAAAGFLSLVEQGELSLDQDINQSLKSWKLPENEFTSKEKVTLRRILSHTSGLSVHGFGGYPRNGPVPSLTQILNGEKPATNIPVRVTFEPGTKWAYSGGGYIIAQQLAMDVTGKPFPQIMREDVFDKIGMNDSTYEQPLPASRAGSAASGTYLNGRVVDGKWQVVPQLAAAGLWTTPADLAKYVIEIALSRKGKANLVLSQAMTAEMLKPQAERVAEPSLGTSQHPDRMGLGFFLGDETDPSRFGHIGDDPGFQAMLVMFSDSGQGAAIMANSERGILLGRLLLASIAKEYRWKYAPAATLNAGTTLTLVAKFKGTPAAIQEYWRLKKASKDSVDENTLLNLGYELFAANKLQDAIRVMKIGVHEYPNYWNSYDSLGEMYLHAGNKPLAIENYEKSVRLNPENQSGIDALRTLKTQK
jgi:CubicO group peptidase (beta-lactamase class C family)